MKIYFFGNISEKKGVNDNQEMIIHILRHAGVDLFTNLKERALPSDLLEIQENGGLILNEMDAFVIEGTVNSPDIGYLLALAIAQKKPVLYLYEKGSYSQELIRHLSGRNVPKFWQIKNYQSANLEKNIFDFFNNLKGHIVKEIPRIKFTLRITPSIEKYLHYKTHNTDKSKADFLREYIEKMMKMDDDYQDFRRREK